MSHLAHIAANKKMLDLRWHILRAVREFFWAEGFIEVETPLLLLLPGQEPHLSPVPVTVHDEKNKAYRGYLHTSPEYAMKKLLAAGYEKIFTICKVFRDRESFGGAHNTEFTMAEWYRTGADFWNLMDDTEKMFLFIQQYLRQKNFQFSIFNFQKLKRTHMRTLWKKYAGVNLDDYLATETLYDLCVKKGYAPKPDEPYEDLFYRIFLNEIEPHLGKETPTIVHHYPLPLAALSKPSEREKGYAERFELYAGGLEIANAFTELTDADEQRRRLEHEQEERRRTEKDVFPIDEDFLLSVGHMPRSAGIALGLDRMTQFFGGCKKIEDVIPFPASHLFRSE